MIAMMRLFERASRLKTKPLNLSAGDQKALVRTKWALGLLAVSRFGV